jgi:hypothetical protein
MSWFDRDSWFDPITLPAGWFDQEQPAAAGGPPTTAVSVAQDQARQEQQGTVATATALTVAQDQARQEQDADAEALTPVVSTDVTVAQDQPRQQQQVLVATATGISVAQQQARQEQDVDAEARDLTVSTDLTVAQDQAAQEQSGSAEANTPAQATAVSGGYYSGRLVPDTRRRPSRQAPRPQKVRSGLTWPARWPEATPEILPPLQPSTNVTVDQAQPAQQQQARAKTAQGWEPFTFQPSGRAPEPLRILRPKPYTPPAAARAPAPRKKAVVPVDHGRKYSEEEALLVILSAADR